MRWQWFVYIIEGQDGTYRIGITDNIKNELEHYRYNKNSKFTKKHGFKALKYYKEYNNIYDARERAYTLNNLNQLEKEALWLS